MFEDRSRLVSSPVQRLGERCSGAFFIDNGAGSVNSQKGSRPGGEPSWRGETFPEEELQYAKADWSLSFLRSLRVGGGALSTLFGAPAYQCGLGFAARDVPDVSYNAAVDGGVLVAYSALGLSQAGFYVVGGTGAGSPQWAGIFALANQLRALLKKPPLGLANPSLYSIAESASYSTDFHDITVGNNILTGTTVGFSAAPGYDLATGWGTPNITNLVLALASK